MGCFFVNLPIRYAAEDTSLLDYFLEKEINPELGLDALALDEFDADWHRRLAEKLKTHGRPCSIHLPFHDLQPGSIDDLVLTATRQRLKQSMRIAALYEPRYLVGHANFIPLYSDMFSKWLNRATTTWKQVLEEWPGQSPPPLYLENVREKDPRPLEDLMSELAEYNVKFCLDIGHWASYGSGSQYKNLPLWIQTMGPYINHLHLHDNDGIADMHLGLGQGSIPWNELFSGLDFLDLQPSFALEPHSKEDLEQSCSFIAKHIFWFTRLGVNHCDIPEL